MNSSPNKPAPSRRADLVAIGLLLLAAAALVRGHLTGQELFLGNFDRLGYFLSTRLSELDAIRSHGRPSAWDDRMFMGFNSAALPGATSPLSPMRLVTEFAPRPQFYYWAGVCVLVLMWLTALSAYVCLRKFRLQPTAAAAGALVYLCCTYAMIRLAQADTSSLMLAALPAGTWLVYGLAWHNARRYVVGIAGLSTLLFYSATGPPTIYLLAFWFALACFAAWERRSWLPPLGCIAGVILGGVMAVPHLVGVARELAGFARDGGVGTDFEAVYRFFNVRPHEFLRVFDEGIFGRAPSEVVALGNNLNSAEGYQLYASSFATFSVLVLLVRFRGKWFRLFLLRDGVYSFAAWAVVLVSAAILVKPIVELTFELFLGAKLIHARMVFIATLPTALLAGLALEEWLGDDHSHPRRLIALALAVGLAALIWSLLQALAERSYVPARLEWWRPAWELLGATARLLVSSRADVGPAPDLAGGPEHPVWLHSGRAVFVLGVALTFALLALFRRLQRTRWWAGQVLLALVIIQTWSEADQRWNGRANHSFPVPFRDNNNFIAPVETLRFARLHRDELNRTLEPTSFRTVFVPEAGQFHHFVAPHLTAYWKIRTVEGYLSGVPERLAALPWPAGTAGFRTISFTRENQLPWVLLGILNVRQALVADTPLFFDVPRPSDDSETALAGSPALRVLPNPSPVLPREFFVERTVPAPEFVRGVVRPSLDADSARHAPQVEGVTEARTWNAEGRIRATYRGDQITLDITPSPEPRFLVLNELYHPRWRAWAGSRDIPIYPVNLVMRGLEVPAGVAQINLEFVPYSRFSGWWAFPLLGIAVSGVLLFPGRGTQQFRSRVPEQLRALGTSARAWRWVAVGAAATALNLALLALLVEVLRVTPTLAPAASALAAISLRYLALDRWVFGNRRPSWRRWAEFHVGMAAGFTIWWLATVLLTGLGVHYLLSAFLAIGSSILVNALSSFGWIWRKHPEKSQDNTA